jgi:hypothetical protein
MNFWQKWPYWLRGMLIGAGIGILLLINLDHCEKYQSIRFPDNEYSGLKCSWIITEGPAFPLYIALLNIPSVRHFSEGPNEYIIFIPIVILSWGLLGTITGIILNSAKSKK